MLKTLAENTLIVIHMVGMKRLSSDKYKYLSINSLLPLNVGLLVLIGAVDAPVRGELNAAVDTSVVGILEEEIPEGDSVGMNVGSSPET